MMEATKGPLNYPPEHYATQVMDRVRWAVLLGILVFDGIGLIYLAR